ncbi:MAG: hypothetical protein JSS53_08430 [Proteobacteria bacterium]|nr:hypothetical protein [Pseudomonadota bacterium]
MSESVKFKVKADYLSEGILIAREKKLSQIEKSLEALGETRRWFLGRQMQTRIDLVSEEINGEPAEIVRQRVLEYLEGNEQWYTWPDRKIFKGHLRDPFGSRRYEVRVCMYYIAIEKYGLLKEQGGVLNETEYEKQKKEVYTAASLAASNFQYKKSKEKKEAPERVRVIRMLKDAREWKAECDFWKPSKENRLKQVVWKYANYCAEASDGLPKEASKKDDAERYKDRALKRLKNAYKLLYTEIPGFKVKIFGIYIYRSKKYKLREATLKASYERNQQLIESIYQDARVLLKEFGLRSLGVLECGREAKEISEESYSKLSEELSARYLEALMQVKGNRGLEDILRLRYFWYSEALWKLYQLKRVVSFAGKVEASIRQEENEFNLDLSKVEDPLCKIQLPTGDEARRCQVDKHALVQGMRGILRRYRDAIVSAYTDEQITSSFQESQERYQRYRAWILGRYPVAGVNNDGTEEKANVTQGIGEKQRGIVENICNETVGILQQVSKWKKWLLAHEEKGRDILFSVKYASQTTRGIEEKTRSQCSDGIAAHDKAGKAHIDLEEIKLLSTAGSSQSGTVNNQSRNIVGAVFSLLRQILSAKKKCFDKKLKKYESLALPESQEPATFEEEVFEEEMKRREAYVRKVVFEEGKKLIEIPPSQYAAAKAVSTEKIEAAVAEVLARTTEVLDTELVEMLGKSLITYPFNKKTPWMTRRVEIMVKRVEGRKSFWDTWIGKISNQSEEMAQVRASMKGLIGEDFACLVLGDSFDLLGNKRLSDEILAIIERCEWEMSEMIKMRIEDTIKCKGYVENRTQDQAEEKQARERKERHQAGEEQARERKEQYQAEEEQARERKDQARVRKDQERKARLELEARLVEKQAKLAALKAAESNVVPTTSPEASEKANPEGNSRKRSDSLDGYNLVGLFGDDGNPVLDDVSSAPMVDNLTVPGPEAALQK